MVCPSHPYSLCLRCLRGRGSFRWRKNVRKDLRVRGRRVGGAGDMGVVDLRYLMVGGWCSSVGDGREGKKLLGRGRSLER